MSGSGDSTKGIINVIVAFCRAVGSIAVARRVGMIGADALIHDHPLIVFEHVDSVLLDQSGQQTEAPILDRWIRKDVGVVIVGRVEGQADSLLLHVGNADRLLSGSLCLSENGEEDGG